MWGVKGHAHEYMSMAPEEGGMGGTPVRPCYVHGQDARATVLHIASPHSEGGVARIDVFFRGWRNGIGRFAPGNWRNIFLVFAEGATGRRNLFGCRGLGEGLRRVGGARGCHKRLGVTMMREDEASQWGVDASAVMDDTD
jgi:hypothetical protein